MSNRNTTDPIIRSSSQEFDDIPIDNNTSNKVIIPSSKQQQEEEEKPTNRMMRTTKNAWRRAVGCCKKSTPRTKIHLKEHQIVKRKKAFGIEYMNLLRSKDVTEEVRLILLDRMMLAISVLTISQFKPTFFIL